MSENNVTRCAVCQLSDGLVINTIVALPTDLPPLDCELVEIQPGQECDIGWYYDGTAFVPPPEVVS